MNDTQHTKELKKQFKPHQLVLHLLNSTSEKIKYLNDTLSKENFTCATTFIMSVGLPCSVLHPNTLLVKYGAIGDVFDSSGQKVCKFHKKC